jgi:hypothetical protein
VGRRDLRERKFFAWTASFRGLLESAGDTVDGLLSIAMSLALHCHGIAKQLVGNDEALFDAGELERPLDHFVLAKWMRLKRGEETILKAKDNVDYVVAIERVIPNIETLYHRLCAVRHPSSASIVYLYDFEADGSFKLSPNKDRETILAICKEYPDALRDALMMHCNPALLILRVLHKFHLSTYWRAQIAHLLISTRADCISQRVRVLTRHKSLSD